MKRVINGRVYNTEAAECIANNEFRDGTNRVSHGRCTSLFRTKKGNYFAYHLTHWQGEHSTIEPLGTEEAKEVYEDMINQNVEYKEAFGEEPEEA